MKLIHCADLHLDSRMTSVLGPDKASERRAELLNTFSRMVDYAQENRVCAILIAGDLFDVKRISATAQNTVLSCITGHPDIRFYYLHGNHDQTNFLEAADTVPENLYLFTEDWKTYTEGEGRIAISGIEANAQNAQSLYTDLVLRPECFNIVLLHGQTAQGKSRTKEVRIDLKKLKNRGIDYLALGHIHAYRRETLDERGIVCYPGCTEGRGFDECGEHGFVLLDIDEETGSFTDTFIPFARRNIFEVRLNVSGLSSSAEMADAAAALLSSTGCLSGDLVRLILTGGTDADTEKDPDYIRSCFADKYYLFDVRDETYLRVDEQDYLLDESLKGEFIRLVMRSDELSEEEKSAVAACGLAALSGEKRLL